MSSNRDDDRLSNLPDKILITILSLLETKEVVQTCLLSKRWRNLWTFVSCLHFKDYDFTDKITGKLEGESLKRFQNFISSFLHLCDNATHLHTFDLSLRGSSCSRTWIVNALRQNPKNLRLDLSIADSVYLPACLFTSKSLEVLELRSVRMLDLDNVFLPKLRKVHFLGVRMKGNSMENFLSGCPALEIVVLDSCFLKTNCISLQTVKQLKMSCCYFISELDQAVRSISAPRLEYLEFLGDVLDMQVKFKDMFRVKEARISIGKEDSWSDSYNCKYLSSLSGVENLQINSFDFGCVSLKEALQGELPNCPIFHKLKHLTLGKECICCGFDVLSSFLKHCPTLERLTLFHRDCRQHDYYRYPVEMEEFGCDRLEVIDVEYDQDGHWVPQLLERISWGKNDVQFHLRRSKTPRRRNCCIYREIQPSSFKFKGSLQAAQPLRGYRRKETITNLEMMSKGDDDRLSNLPDDLLITILSLLKTREMVQTCLLSKRWRNLWTYVPCLHFNDYEFAVQKTRYLNAQGTERFRNFVSLFLRLRNDDTHLHTFSLCLHKSYYSAATWILDAVSHNPKNLHIDLSFGDSVCLPNSLFTCDSLELLELNLNWIKEFEPDNVFLPNLRKVIIADVEMKYDCMENFHFGCPTLQSVELRRCWVLNSNYISFQTVKRLHISYCYFFSGILDQPVCSISAPRLEYLVFFGYASHAVKFKDMWGVKEARINIESNEWGDNSYTCECLSSLSNVEDLQMKYKFTFSYIDLKDILQQELPNCPTFHKLKHLTLGNECIRCGFDSSFMKHCPNLEHLTLFHKDCQQKHYQSMMEIEEFGCNRLRVIDVESEQTVSQLVELFYQSTKNLNDVQIHLRKSNTFFWEESSDISF